MQQLIILFVLAVVVLGDVSHLYRPSYGFAPPFAPKQTYQRNPVKPVGVFGGVHQQHQQPQVAIVRQSVNSNQNGNYQWAYETSNGIAAQERGLEREVVPGESKKSVQGSYKYTSPDGTPVAVSYIANENGYQPQGAHIPAAILRGLQYNAAHLQKAPVVRPYVTYG